MRHPATRAVFMAELRKGREGGELLGRGLRVGTTRGLQSRSGLHSFCLRRLPLPWTEAWGIWLPGGRGFTLPP
ncbi:MAG: hypothetical protein EA421_08285 [Gemmatimonadales bacterium]|nr:MAG: hypothetical protein EA421_08285 [Gemmatimonadales bacterium]